MLAENPGIGHTREDLTDRPVRFWKVFSYPGEVVADHLRESFKRFAIKFSNRGGGRQRLDHYALGLVERQFIVGAISNWVRSITAVDLFELDERLEQIRLQPAFNRKDVAKQPVGFRGGTRGRPQHGLRSEIDGIQSSHRTAPVSVAQLCVKMQNARQRPSTESRF